MLIGIFKKSRTLTPVILILVALSLWLDGFLFFDQHRLSPDQAAPLFGILVPFVENYPLLQVVTAWVFLIIQAFLLNQIVTSKNLMERHTLLPALLYVVLMSSDFGMLSLSPLLFANFFLLLALNKIFDSYTEREVALEVFNVGLLTAMAALFYLPALMFFFMALVSLFIYRVGTIRGILATMLGFATPFLFMGVIWYLMDEPVLQMLELPAFLGLFQHSFSYYTQVLLVFLGLLFLVSFFRVFFSYVSDKPIRIRKRFTVLVWFFFIGLISMLMAEGYYEVHLSLLIIPLSMVLAVFFMEVKKNRWAELIFSLLLVLIIIGKLARLD